MKRLLTIILAAAMVVGCFAGFAAAEGATAELQAAKQVGDINDDGVINAKDVTILRRGLAGGYGIPLNPRAADANGDGVISAKDITILRRYLAGGYGITLGRYFDSAGLSYNGVVTGGQLYDDLGAPDFGAGGYTLHFVVDGVEQDAAFYAARIVAENADPLTVAGSYTDVLKDESAKTITVNTHVLFQDGGVQYETVTLDLNGGSGYRVLGRGRQLEAGVRCDWQGDGVEFIADCGGDLYLTASRYYELTNNLLQFRVIVDGVIGDWVTIRASYRPETRTALAFSDIPAGRHTIRILRDSPVDHCESTLLSVTLDADPDSIRASEPRPMMMEILGASTATGAGILPTPEGGDPTTTHNTATFVYSFGYLAAEALNLDIMGTVKGTLGIVKQAGTGSSTNNNLFNLPELYPYQNRYRNAYAGQELELYGFERKADIIVLMINENDASVGSEVWTAAARDFIAMMRGYNGENTPIVFVYYRSGVHKPDVLNILSDTPHTYGLSIKPNGEGSGDHASGEAHVEWAQQLIPLLRTVISDMETGGAGS